MDTITRNNAFMVDSVIQLMKNVIREEKNREFLHTDLRPMENLLLDIRTLSQEQPKEAQEAIKIWMQLLHNSFTEARSLLQRPEPGRRQRCLDFLICKPGRLFKEIKEWKVLFDYLFQGLERDFSIFVSAHQIVNRDPIPRISAEDSLQTISEDEAWMLFRRIAFKDNDVPMDREEYARNIADECKGFPLAITLVAATLRGKTRVEEWKTSLSSIKNAVRSSPETLPPSFNQELYQRFKWSYDALPNSDVKNCFLYCAMYPKDEEIAVQDLVQLWIAEGFVRSKQEDHLMDMAIGRSYLNLLVDRCFFQNVTDEEGFMTFWDLQRKQRIRVHHVIREMAIYIGQQEENSFFKAGEQLQIFPAIHNEDCKRISLLNSDIENLPTEFPHPKLVSLILSIDASIEEIPSGFLVSLKLLKVFHLNARVSGSRINSITSSVGQLKQLEFLSLRNLENIRDLPEDICYLSCLQFLDLEKCSNLQSLPSQIGELKNLKYLCLRGCVKLQVIPHEISQLTSLNTLDAHDVKLSPEAESEASVGRLKGLSNLRMLRIRVEQITSSGIDGNIMGTWLDMRHLFLRFSGYRHRDDVIKDLPEDMKKMRKLQSFEMWGYLGSSLPDYTCNFQHLENIALVMCPHLRELSPLERLPNLKCLNLWTCQGLKELGIGKSGFLMLEELALLRLHNLESIAGSSDNGAWNEGTLPRLSVLKILLCPKLKRLPLGMDKLRNLRTIFGGKHQIIWEDEGMKRHLEKVFK